MVLRPSIDGEKTRLIGWIGGTHSMRYHAHTASTRTATYSISSPQNRQSKPPEPFGPIGADGKTYVRCMAKHNLTANERESLPFTTFREWQFKPRMDSDEHRLIVDFYLCKFVFICGCLRRFRSEA